jgi:hypothetical protein
VEAFRVVDLYALPPEEFTAARDALGPAHKKLRKPTVAAWVVNTLVRQEPALLEQLLALGADLAAAQSGRDAAALRTLGDQRRQLVAAVANRAVELVDRPVSPAVREEVQATLEAALADPPSAAAVVSGSLVRSLSYAGFGGVDLEGAVAAVPAPAAPAKEKGKVAKLERAAQEAAGALDDAVRHAERIEREATAAQHETATAQEAARAATARAEDLRAALKAAETTEKKAAANASKAAKEAGELDRKAERALTAVATAQEAADRARAALDAARRA